MDTDYDRIAEQYKNQKLLNVFDSQSDEYSWAFGVFLAHTDQKAKAAAYAWFLSFGTSFLVYAGLTRRRPGGDALPRGYWQPQMGECDDGHRLRPDRGEVQAGQTQALADAP